jgi:hypothetical protein
MKSLRPGNHRAVIVLLLGLMAVAFAVEGSQPSHSHADGRLGLYVWWRSCPPSMPPAGCPSPTDSHAPPLVKPGPLVS